MVRVFLFVLAFLFISSRAFAVELNVIETKGAVFVALSGAIGPQDADKVIAGLAVAAEKHKGDNKVVGLSLNSPGGLIVEAVKIGEFVRSAKAPVLVTQQSTCASACFLIFMNAPAKFVIHGARIGVHSASFNGKEDASTADTTVKIARLAREAGVPQSVVGKMVTAEPGDMNYLSDAELKQMGASFLDDDDSPVETKPNPEGRVATPASSQPAQTSAMPQPSGSVSYKASSSPPPPPGGDPAEEQQRAEFKAEQDRNFARYWSQIVNWSKAQHSGGVASERRCNKGNCATIVAYFDRQQRYVEAWRYDEPPQGSGVKLVCRQVPEGPRLSCKDWYDEHEFLIGYSHQIGEDRVSNGGDLLDIFK